MTSLPAIKEPGYPTHPKNLWLNEDFAMFTHYPVFKDNLLHRVFPSNKREGETRIHFSGFLVLILFLYLCTGCSIAPVIPDNQENLALDFFNDGELYNDIASYCYNFTGYGGESCLDWTESVLENHLDSVSDCFAPFVAGLLSDEQFDIIGECLDVANVPSP